MKPVSPLLLSCALLAAPACYDDNQTHTFKGSISDDGGVVKRIKIKGPTGWESSFAEPSVSFPDDPEAPDQVTFNIAPRQPGTYGVDQASFYFQGDGALSASGPITVHMDEVEWTGKQRFPFTYRGSVEGAYGGLLYEGAFTFATESCTNEVTSGPGDCGGDFLWGSGDEEVEVQLAMPEREAGGCPDELLDLFWVGDTVTLTRDEAVTGEGARAIECIETNKGAGGGWVWNVIYENDVEEGDIGPYACGESLKHVEGGGCDDWRVTTYAYPYNDAGHEGLAWFIHGGADCDGAPTWCYNYFTTEDVLSEVGGAPRGLASHGVTGGARGFAEDPIPPLPF